MGHFQVKTTQKTQQIDIAAEKSTLVAVDELTSELEMAFLHIKNALQDMCNKLKAIIDVRYPIDLDPAILLTETEHALSELEKHCSNVSRGGKL